MVSHRATGAPEPRRGDPELLLRMLGFVLIAVGAIVAALITSGWRASALALAGLALAACGVLASLARLLRDDDEAEPESPGRAAAIALAVAAAATLVGAVALSRDEVSASSTSAPTPRAAEQTVRSFLSTAVLQDDPYAACQYLTGPAQGRVARLAGAPTCREALTEAPPGFDGLRSVVGLDHLRLRAVVHGDRATVVVTPPHGRPATFVLRRATAAELAAFEAPAAPWRIESGVRALLR